MFFAAPSFRKLVCPRSLRKEILHKFYGNTTNTSVTETRSEKEVIAALVILSLVSKYA